MSRSVISTRSIITMACLLVGAFGLSYSLSNPASDRNERRSTPVNAGRELVMVYVGSSRCAYSNDPSVPGVLQVIAESLETFAHSHKGSVVRLGIGVSPSVSQGAAYFRRFDGMFDELILGRSWVNTGMMRYVLRDFQSVPVTPQLIVTTRRLHDSVLDGLKTWTVSDESLVLRRVGLAAIQSLEHERPQLAELVSRKMALLDQ